MSIPKRPLKSAGLALVALALAVVVSCEGAAPPPPPAAEADLVVSEHRMGTLGVPDEMGIRRVRWEWDATKLDARPTPGGLLLTGAAGVHSVKCIGAAKEDDSDRRPRTRTLTVRIDPAPRPKQE